MWEVGQKPPYTAPLVKAWSAKRARLVTSAPSRLTAVGEHFRYGCR